MLTVYVGYPGTGLRTWCEQQTDNPRLFVCDDGNLSDVPNTIETNNVAAVRYSEETLQNLIDGGIACTLIYPAPECINEYLERYRVAGYSEEELIEASLTISNELQTIRETDRVWIKHIVLGRDEYVGDKIPPMENVE